MALPENYWLPIETQWAAANLSQLQRHVHVMAGTHALVAHIATHPEIEGAEQTVPLGVSRLLMRRIGEELRAVEILAINGHGFQAAANACNVFEQGHYLSYINLDDAHAQKFAEWTDPHKQLLDMKSLIDKSGKLRGWSQDRCDEEYKTYRFLCGFKHNNPVFQRLLQLPVDPDLYLAQFSMANGMWSVASAIAMLAVIYLKPVTSNELLNTVNQLMDDTRSLFPSLNAPDGEPCHTPEHGLRGFVPAKG